MYIKLTVFIITNSTYSKMQLLPDVWREDYWLPSGVTWSDMERLSDSERPRPRDLFTAPPLALGFVALRYVFERFVAPPMGRCLGVNDRVTVGAPPLPKAGVLLHPEEPTSSTKTQRQIQTWFRLRRNQDRPSQTTKFGEAAWRFFFYLSAFVGGLSCLIDRRWFWDHRECWREYPVQPMDSALYWYYMLELGFYGSLLLRISVDIKRKDFKEQVIHHLATIFLLSFSYCANYIRIGTLVMLLHDSSDILLESAKMFNYGSAWKRTRDLLFVAFALVFLLTRLVIFPNNILHTTLVLSMEVFRPFPGYYFFNVLLMVLQALHIFWAALIIRMIYKFLKGKVRTSHDAKHSLESTKTKKTKSVFSPVLML
uniref:Ceramide synthase 4b n=1 Tax=Gouania willdenowi TaxID=441366 RepID=A0A8C5GUW7_GOUWI